MSGQALLPEQTAQDLLQWLKIELNPDGSTLNRRHIPPTSEPSSDPNNTAISVLSKDITLNQQTNTWARIHIPHQALHNLNNTPSKLPLIIHYHGGGFILGHPNLSYYHIICSNLAALLQVVIISVEYRLAPEHRLPAAYDDAFDALNRIKTVDDDWIQKCVDLSNCFLLGDSAGANIAFHTGLKAAKFVDKNLQPLRIRGLILHQPFFGGAQRTESELRLQNDPILPLSATDLMWSLALPVGADRDHEYCNPMVGSDSKIFETIKSLGWRVLVTACDGDLLYDRQIEFMKMMEDKGVKMVSHLEKGGTHGPERLHPLHQVLKNFIFAS